MDLKIPEAYTDALANDGAEAYKEVIEHEGMVWISEIGDNNPEAIAGISEYCANAVIEKETTENTVKVSARYPDSSNVEDLQSGTHPALGGDNGIVTHVDGSQTQSNVRKALWDTPAEWLAVQPHMFHENVQTVANTMVTNRIQESAHDNSGMIIEENKPALAQELAKALGGS